MSIEREGCALCDSLGFSFFSKMFLNGPPFKRLKTKFVKTMQSVKPFEDM